MSFGEFFKIVFAIKKHVSAPEKERCEWGNFVNLKDHGRGAERVRGRGRTPVNPRRGPLNGFH